MSEVTEFLLARIAEDEADPWRGAELIGSDRVVGRAEYDALAADGDRWEARVLAECAAKRAIVEIHELTDYQGVPSCYLCAPEYSWGKEPDEGPCDTLRHLAMPYADHDDYRDEWRIG